jgi:hypothetical protein
MATLDHSHGTNDDTLIGRNRLPEVAIFMHFICPKEICKAAVMSLSALSSCFLILFFNLGQAIVSTGKTGEIILWNLHTESSSRNDFSAVGDSIKRASRVTKITDNITNAILDERPKSILSIASILLVLIIRVEAHEYEIGNMLANAKKHINPFNYDTQEILSVNSKVQKGSGWRTDTREIRDAVSHAKFTINKRDGRYVIHFKNTEGGYNFEKTFTETDAMLFYQDYARLIAIQTLLLNSVLISDFLTKEFKK